MKFHLILFFSYFKPFIQGEIIPEMIQSYIFVCCSECFFNTVFKYFSKVFALHSLDTMRGNSTKLPLCLYLNQGNTAIFIFIFQRPWELHYLKETLEVVKLSSEAVVADLSAGTLDNKSEAMME